MAEDNETKILGNKATIYTNKFGMWQFRLWLANENKYVRKSLKTKEKTLAIERGEELYIEVAHKQKSGIKHFGISIKEGVEQYIEARSKEVGLGNVGIVKGRLDTIKTHLKHFLEYVRKDDKVTNLSDNTLVYYERNGKETTYLHFRLAQNAAPSTISNEMSTINACMNYLYSIRKASYIARFHLPKFDRTKYDKSGEGIRRQTFEYKEWQSFTTAMRSYCAKVKLKLTDEEYFERELVRHYFLFAANSGLRSGELKQLSWYNVDTFRQDETSNTNEDLLANVFVEAQTSKVRKARRLYCRGGYYIERWRSLVKKYGTNDSGLVFSRDGIDVFPNSTLHKHFRRILLLTDISLERQKELVPYSIRHFMITNRIQSGCRFSDVAYMCGTSIKQIEQTYFHLTDEMMMTTATADFIRKDGKVIPIGNHI